VVTLRRLIHARPELGFAEIETASLVIQELEGAADRVEWGQAVCDVRGIAGLPGSAELAAARARARASGVPERLVDELGHGATGVVATLIGTSPGPTVALRFDMDALAVEEQDGPDHLPAREGFASAHPGVMHACGHDGHVAIGIELGRRLAADRDFPGEVRLIFQPAEEGVRGARAMLAAGVTADVDVLVGVHLGIGLPLGAVAAGAQGVMATEKWRITLTGRSAHAALSPHEGRNALLGAAAAALALHGLPPYPGATTRANVGRLVAGSASNIVPGDALLECEFRADDSSVLADLLNRARAVVEGAAAMHGLDAAIAVTGAAATARADDTIVEALCQAADGVPGATDVRPFAPMSASDDVTLFMGDVQSRGGLATLALVGASSPVPHHHPSFDVDERALPLAVEWLERAVRSGLPRPVTAHQPSAGHGAEKGSPDGRAVAARALAAQGREAIT